MALTLTNIGKRFISEKRILSAVSNDASCKFVKIEISSSLTSGVIFEATNQPEIGTTDTFLFEINSIIRELYTTEFMDLTASTSSGIAQPFPFVTGLISELDEDGTVLSTVSIPTTTTFNISRNIFQVNSFDIDDYYLGSTGTVTSKFATDSPSVLELVEGDSLFLGLNDFSGASASPSLDQRVVVESYDSAGSLTATDYVTLTSRGFQTAYYGLRNGVRITMESGVAYKLVYIADVVGGTIRSEVKRVNNICNARYVHLHWINEFGFQDAYYFKGEQIKSINTESRAYEQARPVNPSTADVGMSFYSNVYREKWILYTDSISQDTIGWLKGIYVNKNVAVEIDGNYFPAMLDSDSLIYYRDINGIYQIQIPIIFSNKTIGNH